MTDTDEITRAVLKYVKEELLEGGGPAIGPQTRLLSAGIVDSFSVVSLRRYVENAYGVSIPDERVTPEAFDGAGRIAALVAELLQGRE